MTISVIAVVAAVAIVVGFLMYLASRYRRCPSDRILVIYGRVGVGQSAQCIHGGGKLILPLVQDYAYLSLTPMTISIPLQNALSLQNIRINVPSTFTVGISTESHIMNNAAERLLGLQQAHIEDMAREIIFGQLRLTVASLTIEQINQDRESFLESIRKNVEPELNKIGLYLINVNITDITDESDYIESIGKKAAAEAINKAAVDVSEQEKFGAIGQSEANREREIRVAQNLAEAEKGRKAAESGQRVYVQQQEAEAIKGEKQAVAEQRIYVQQQEAEAIKGEKQAVAEQRVFVQQQEAQAIDGENKAKASIADYNAQLAIKEAEALQRGEVARRDAEVEIQKAQYRAEQERLTAQEVVREEIGRRKIEIAAEAQAEKLRREARGEADAILARYQAEAEGIRKVLEAKALGYRELVNSAGGNAKSAATLLMIEKLENIVSTQVEAIKNLKIDKITVWDSGSATGQGSSTSNFVSSLIRSLPPLHEIAAMAGVELPNYLGEVKDKAERNGAAPAQTPAGPLVK
ncbi:MAG: flotillin family protein [Myxococcales bacterium]|nr:MAG: flotillin family protein [Myxococcales bacterium]